jgi:hypothetical protein
MDILEPASGPSAPACSRCRSLTKLATYLANTSERQSKGFPRLAAYHCLLCGNVMFVDAD